MPQRPSRSAAERPWLRVVTEDGAKEPRPLASDDEILAAVESGDHRVAAQLYDRLIPVVDGTLYRLLGRREAEHDDLVQTTFEQIVLTITKRKYARACSLATWASTVATHVGLNALRSRIRERRVVDRFADTDLHDTCAPSSANVEREVTARRELERLRCSLAEMDRDKAETLVLHDVLGHELADIAVMTKVSVAAAQSRLVRARKELAARLGDVESSPPPGRKS